MVALAALALAACQTQPADEPADDASANVATDPVAVRQTIDSLNPRLEGWYAAGQIDSVTVFAEDVRQVPPNNEPLVGREAMHAFWTQAAAWGRWQFDFNVEDVVVADAIAVERGSHTVAFTAGPQAPMPSAEDRGCARHAATGDHRWIGPARARSTSSRGNRAWTAGTRGGAAAYEDRSR